MRYKMTRLSYQFELKYILALIPVTKSKINVLKLIIASLSKHRNPKKAKESWNLLFFFNTLFDNTNISNFYTTRSVVSTSPTFTTIQIMSFSLSGDQV